MLNQNVEKKRKKSETETEIVPDLSKSFDLFRIFCLAIELKQGRFATCFKDCSRTGCSHCGLGLPRELELLQERSKFV